MGTLLDALKRSREALGRALGGLVAGGLSPGAKRSLEEALLAADVGPRLAARLVEEALAGRPATEEALRGALAERAEEILKGRARTLDPAGRTPYVVLLVGVNGGGKTTTTGKLAHAFRERGLSVVVAGADTFRAAAGEQAAVWAERAGAEIISGSPGADPAAVAFDALAHARARSRDVLLVDTAGRLHTREELVEELKKVRRVLAKGAPGAPHEVLLVLDGTTGQNALAQARRFHESLGVTGIVVTKLDSTSRGGALLGVVAELGLPVVALGVGEGAGDLVPFDPALFAQGLFGAAP